MIFTDNFTSTEEKFTRNPDGWSRQTEKLSQYQEAKNKSEQAHRELDRHLESSERHRKTKTIYKQERYFDTETGQAGYNLVKEKVPVDESSKSLPFQKASQSIWNKLDNEISKVSEHNIALEAGQKTSKQLFKMSKGIIDWRKNDTRLKQQNTDATFKIEARKADWTLAGKQAEVEYFSDISSNSDKKKNKKRQRNIFNEMHGIKEPEKPVITADMSREEISAVNNLYKTQMKEFMSKKKLDKLCAPKIQRRKSLLEAGVVGLGMQGRQFVLNSMEQSDNAAASATSKGFEFTSSTISKAKRFIQNQRSHQINKFRTKASKASAQQAIDKNRIKNAQKKAAQKKLQKNRNRTFFNNTTKSAAAKNGVKGGLFKTGIGKILLIIVVIILLIVIIVVGIIGIAGSMTTVIPAVLTDASMGWFVGNEKDVTDEKVTELFDKSQNQVKKVINDRTIGRIDGMVKAAEQASGEEFHDVVGYANSVTQDDPIINQILITLATKRFIQAQAENDGSFNEEALNLKFKNDEIFNMSTSWWEVASEKETPYYCPTHDCCTRPTYGWLTRADGTDYWGVTGEEKYCDGHHTIEHFWPERINPLESIFSTNEERGIYNFIAAYLFEAGIIKTEESIPLLPDETEPPAETDTTDVTPESTE